MTQTVPLELIDPTGVFPGDLTLPSMNGGQLAGMRNKIINGKMEVSQRGTTFTAAANGIYTVDRWQFVNVATTAVLTVSQQTDTPSTQEFQSSVRMAVTTADTSIGATDLTLLQQSIEGYNIRDLIGRTFVLSFWVRSSKTGIHCVAFRNSGSDRSYVVEYTVAVANTWEKKTVVVTGGLTTAGTWDYTNGIGLLVRFSIAAGSTYRTTANAWNTGNFLATANQVNGLDTIGNIFAITGVQLEVGTTATPYEHRTYGGEFMMCQRYYQTITWGADYFAGTGAPAIYRSMSLPVAMRAAPTTGFPAGSIAYSTTGGNQTPISIQVTAPTPSSFLVIMTASPNITGWPSFGPLTFSAELA